MKLKSNFYAPILFGVVLILAGISSLLFPLTGNLTVDAFLSSTIIQLVVYLLPLAFYCKVRGFDLTSTLKLKSIKPQKIPFFVNMTLIFFVGSILLRYMGLFFFDGAMAETPSAIYIPAEGSNRFLNILCSIILPAVFEELLFRGILLKEYRSYGTVLSIFVSSLMFAMLHLSLRNFFYYFFMGVVFSIITRASQSVVPTILIHIATGFSHFYLRPAIVEYLRQVGKSPILPYLLIALFILLFVFMFSGLEGIYQDRTYEELLHSRKELLRKEVEKSNKTGEETEEDGKKRLLLKLKEIFVSPSFLAVLIIYIFFVSNVLKGVIL